MVKDCGIDAVCVNGSCVPKVIDSDSGPEPSPELAGIDAADVAGDAARDVLDAGDIPNDEMPNAVDAPPEKGIAEDTPGDPAGDQGLQDAEMPMLVPDIHETQDGGDVAGDLLMTDIVAECGNGVLEPGEDCDGQQMGNATCTQLLYGDGTLGCRDDCTYDTLLCGENSHRFSYDSVPNIWFKGTFVDVSWHPEGEYALIVGYSSIVIRFDPQKQPLDALDEVGSATGVSLRRIDFSPSGDAYVVGYDIDGKGHVFRVPDGGGSLVELPDAQQNARFVSIKFTPDGSYALIAGRSGNSNTNFICTLDPATGTTHDFKGYSSYGGVSDLMWVPGFGQFEGILGALLVHGVNGKDAWIWNELSKEIYPANSGTASFGNMGRCSYRNGSHYGLVSGTSSNVLYVYSGNIDKPLWDKEYLDDIGSGVLETAFRPDGKRALVIGRPWGDPLTLHILEHRPVSDTFSGDDFIAQHIPDWDASPFFANSNTYLTAAAFRPGTKCDEGLIVGDDPGTVSAPSFGTIVIFRDTDSLDCPQ